MNVPINYFAVFVSAVVSMVVGALWYGPLFGKLWVSLMGMTKENMASAKAKGMGKSYILMFIGSLLMAYTLAHAIIFASTYLNIWGVSGGLMGGFWNWLGFIVPVTMGVVLWENKPWKLWFLNAIYYLINLLVMGVILSIWK